jgi:hypothetical protein
MAKKQADTVYKVVEVVGVSERSWGDAAVLLWKQQPARCATYASPK